MGNFLMEMEANVRTLILCSIGLLYLFFGAGVFSAIEKTHEEIRRAELLQEKSHFQRIHNFSETDFRNLSRIALELQPHNSGIQWGFVGALYFAITVVTTIGYGHAVPQTTGGKIFCMIYATMGIPICLIMFQAMGERINNAAKYCLKTAGHKLGFKFDEVSHRCLVPFGIFSCLLTLIVGSSSFAYFEGWTYIDSVYYCAMTLTTIGFGDYVALQEDGALQNRPHYVAFSLIYIMIGLTVIGAFLNLVILRMMITLPDTPEGSTKGDSQSTGSPHDYELEGHESNYESEYEPRRSRSKLRKSVRDCLANSDLDNGSRSRKSNLSKSMRKGNKRKARSFRQRNRPSWMPSRDDCYSSDASDIQRNESNLSALERYHAPNPACNACSYHCHCFDAMHYERSFVRRVTSRCQTPIAKPTMTFGDQSTFKRVDSPPRAHAAAQACQETNLQAESKPDSSDLAQVKGQGSKGGHRLPANASSSQKVAGMFDRVLSKADSRFFKNRTTSPTDFDAPGTPYMSLKPSPLLSDGAGGPVVVFNKNNVGTTVTMRNPKVRRSSLGSISAPTGEEEKRKHDADWCSDTEVLAKGEAKSKYRLVKAAILNKAATLAGTPPALKRQNGFSEVLPSIVVTACSPKMRKNTDSLSHQDSNGTTVSFLSSTSEMEDGNVFLDSMSSSVSGRHLSSLTSECAVQTVEESDNGIQTPEPFQVAEEERSLSPFQQENGTLNAEDRYQKRCACFSPCSSSRKISLRSLCKEEESGCHNHHHSSCHARPHRLSHCCCCYSHREQRRTAKDDDPGSGKRHGRRKRNRTQRRRTTSDIPSASMMRDLPESPRRRQLRFPCFAGVSLFGRKQASSLSSSSAGFSPVSTSSPERRPLPRRSDDVIHQRNNGSKLFFRRRISPDSYLPNNVTGRGGDYVLSEEEKFSVRDCSLTTTFVDNYDTASLSSVTSFTMCAGRSETLVRRSEGRKPPERPQQQRDSLC